MKKATIILVVFILMMVSGCSKPQGCTADCRTVCNIELNCCYDGCVPSSCGDSLDIDKVKKAGYPYISATMDNAPDTSQWPVCGDQLNLV